jgi:hypothetical protein
MGLNPAYGMGICFSVMCYVEALGRTDPPSKESYQISELQNVTRPKPCSWRRKEGPSWEANSRSASL